MTMIGVMRAIGKHDEPGTPATSKIERHSPTESMA
jgi:hypothetical protein